MDSTHAGKDAGAVLDGHHRGVPVFASVEEAVGSTRSLLDPNAVLIVALESASGRLTSGIRSAVTTALQFGLSVINPLPDLLTSDPELVSYAHTRGCSLLDLRAPPPLNTLHRFSGRIHEISAPRVAVLGTDSVVGKRTTAWSLVDGFNAMGVRAEFVGTGQTAYLQGARFCFVLDAVINNYVPGELEHVVHTAWTSEHPDVIVIEGQGSLLSPAYQESQILVVTRPAAVVLQHALGRQEYLDSGGVQMHDLRRHIKAIEAVGGCPVVGVAINPEGLSPAQATQKRLDVETNTRLPTVDVLRDGAEDLVDALKAALHFERS